MSLRDMKLLIETELNDAWDAGHEGTGFDHDNSVKRIMAALGGAGDPVAWMDHMGGVITAAMKNRDPGLPYNIPLTHPAGDVQVTDEAGKARAIKAAVSAIYFDDSSDYCSALWEVVRVLNPAMVELLESDPEAAYQQASAALNPGGSRE